MTDKENLKTGLEEVSDFFFEMYRKETDEYKAAKAKEYCDIAEDVIAMLKEQEPQSVIVREKPQNGNILWFADCPKCKYGIERDKHKHFCGFCGQAVKWE